MDPWLGTLLDYPLEFFSQETKCVNEKDTNAISMKKNAQNKYVNHMIFST